MVVVIGFSLDSPLDEPGRGPSATDHPYWDRDTLAVLASRRPRAIARSDPGPHYHFRSDHTVEHCDFPQGCGQPRHYRSLDHAQDELKIMEQSTQRFESFSLAGHDGSIALRMMEVLFLHRRKYQTVASLIHPTSMPAYEALLLELAHRGAVDCEFVTTERFEGGMGVPGERTLKWTTVGEIPGTSTMAEYLSENLVLTDYGSMLLDVLHLDSFLSGCLSRIPKETEESASLREKVDDLRRVIDSSRAVPLHPKLPEALRAFDSYPKVKGYLELFHLKRMTKCSTREARLILRDLDRLGLLNTHTFIHPGRRNRQEHSVSYEDIRSLGGGKSIARMLERRELPDGSSVSASFGS